jgi:very-short-patch-repair endonuclease
VARVCRLRSDCAPRSGGAASGLHICRVLFGRRTSVDGDDRRQRRDKPGSGATTGVDARIGGVATEQDGLIARAQLLALGLSVAAIDHRVRTRRLIVVHRGVYAVGHAALSRRARWRAGLMAAGETAVLSHTTAATAWQLILSMPAFVEVTVTRKGPRTRAGLVVHETRRAPQVRLVDSLPVTAPLRTLADLGSHPQIERMCAEALVLKHVTQQELDAARILSPERAAPTRSELERRFLALIREAGLPRPRVNEAIGGHLVDFAWLDERVIVETDGWAAHGHRAAFERDHARDADLAARGWIVVRFTWRQVCDAPTRVVAQVSQTLAARRSTQGAVHEAVGARR